MSKRKAPGSSRLYRSCVSCPITFDLKADESSEPSDIKRFRGILLKDEALDPPAVRVLHEDGLARLWKYSEVDNLKPASGKLAEDQRKLADKQHVFQGGSGEGRNLFFTNALQDQQVEVRSLQSPGVLSSLYHTRVLWPRFLPC